MTLKDSEIPLLAIHGALSAIPFAIEQALPEVPMDITIQWRSGTNLSVQVGTYGRWVQRVVAQLIHGVMPGEYDYRFDLIGSRPDFGPLDYVTITASLVLSHTPPEEAKLKRWYKLEAVA